MLRWLIVVALSAGAVAHAQKPPAPAPAEDPALAEAKVHFQQGVALFNDENFSAALAEFETAYRLRPSPGVLYNIGLTQKRLFRYGEAIDALERFIKESTDLPAERRAEAEQLIAEMRALMAEVTVHVEPAGAQILLDGRTVGTAPLDKPLGIAAGGHVLEATAEGHKPVRRELMVSAGVPVRLDLRLEAIPKTGKARIVASQPMAEVMVDGRSLGAAPVDVELGPGGHTLEVVAPGYVPYRSELVVAAGQVRTVEVALELPPRQTPVYKKWYLWTPIAVGVAAGLGLGLGLGLTPQPPLEGTLSPGVGRVN